MKDEGYNQVFVLPNGEEITVLESYQGRFLAVPIQRIYEDESRKEDNEYMSTAWKKLKCKKIEKNRNLMNIKNGENYQAIDTFVLAENKSWKEYPTVNNYTGEHACNCEYYTKIEVILAEEEYSRRLFIDWKGRCNFYDFVSNLANDIWEELLDEKYFAKYDEESKIATLDFYTNNGESVNIEITSDRDIEDKIMSIRVVEFKETICK